jgi:mannose-6-phosphate isomerase-like protein (cupin superfamily)
MSYVVEASTSPAFSLHGLAGYEFLPLKDPDFAVHILDVRTGHDTFMISKALTRIYYIIEGEGVFTIDNQNHDVSSGLLVEVPPGVEYSYSGRMKILLVSHPRWFEGNERMTRKNPNVASETAVEGIAGDRLTRYFRNFVRRVSVVTRFRRIS